MASSSGSTPGSPLASTAESGAPGVIVPGGVLRTAFVGGASKGIGRAVAKTLAARGVRVVACGRSAKELDELIKELPLLEIAPGVVKGHKAFVCDLSDTEKLPEALRGLVKELGGMDILVLNAGGPKSGPVLDAAPADFTEALKPHLFANQILVQTFAPLMKSKTYGRIVCIISTSVKAPIPGLGVSNTVRAAVASWAKTLAGELAPYGVTVNCVLPGYTATSRLKDLSEAAATRRGISAEQVVEEWKKATPMGRLGEPEEIAAAVSFFASPAASFITGQALAVDGGRLPGY
ncbi:MAG TPA: SDR family oxidoreductase [Pseudobdellovibrionaceae bacterium]|nr:SDR family oxidoreductase [Pseudobdellovibrionaceae bacterium]